MNICSNLDVQVYFHAKEQFLDLSGRLGNKIYLGKRYETQITAQDAYTLEYKNVHNGIILYDSDRKCSYEPYDTCIYKMLTKVMVEESENDCTVPWVLDNSRICTKPDDINKTFWIAWSRITNQKRDCLKPCHTTLINVGAKNELTNEENEYAQLYAYFSSNVVQSREHYFITVIKLAGQIGGYIGLFRLALTILNLVKFDTLIKDTNLTKEKPESAKDDGIESDATGTDQLIGLSPLAIDSHSFRVVGN